MMRGRLLRPATAGLAAVLAAAAMGFGTAGSAQATAIRLERLATAIALPAPASRIWLQPGESVAFAEQEGEQTLLHLGVVAFDTFGTLKTIDLGPSLAFAIDAGSGELHAAGGDDGGGILHTVDLVSGAERSERLPFLGPHPSMTVGAGRLAIADRRENVIFLLGAEKGKDLLVRRQSCSSIPRAASAPLPWRRMAII